MVFFITVPCTIQTVLGHLEPSFQYTGNPARFAAGGSWLSELVQNLGQYPLQQDQSVLVIAPELGISQLLEDAGFGGGFQGLCQLGSLLFQPLVFSNSLGEGYAVLGKLSVHLLHCRNITVQQLGNLGGPLLAVERPDAGKQIIQLLTLFVEAGHLLEDTGRDMVAARLAGALTALQVGVFFDHVLPELVLPPA